MKNVSDSGGWKKSSFSSQGGDCVEVLGTLVAVRDSKCPAAMLPGVDVRALVSAVRAGRLG